MCAETAAPPVIAVSESDHKQFGCPTCGYRSGHSHVSFSGAMTWRCGECDTTCVVLAEGVDVSPIGFGQDHPELQTHPREGIPSHGRPDERPKSGGEFCEPRPVGMDRTPGCFICGGDDDLHHNFAGFVRCKESGERVVTMFEHGVRLDYREHEPDRVQVKIGACREHKPNLEHLQQAVRTDGIITEKRIAKAIAA